MLNKKATILIVTGLFPPEIGGPATYSKILLEELPSRNFEVKILPFSLVRKYPTGIRHLIFSYLICRQSRGADIIYAMDPVSVGLPVMISCFFLRRSYWLKVVGDYAWEQGCQRSGVKEMLDIFSTQSGGYGWLVRILKIIQTTVSKRAKRIVVPSEYLKKIVSNWGVNPTKIGVVYNAFEGRSLTMTKEEARVKLGFTPEERILISVGRLVPWKGFSTLIYIMPTLLNKYPAIKLLIIGDGPEAKNLQEKIKQADLTQNVLMLGRLDQSDLFQYIKASDLFILNTAYEGFSHQLLEVMNLETIALVTDIGGNPELIKNQHQLFSYDDKNQITDLIKKFLDLSEEDIKKIGQQEKTFAGQFTREKMVIDLISEFKKYENL